MFNTACLLAAKDRQLSNARIATGSIAGKASMGLSPVILCMVLAYSALRESEGRICQMSVWICKEQAFWLVSRGVLLYTLIERRDPAVSSL
jgi:hypothetical protein